MSHIEWIIEESIERGFGNSWWVATTHDTADIAYRRTKQRLNGFIQQRGKLKRVGEPIPFKSNETRRIIWVGGAAIWFKTAEKPDNLFGEDVHTLVGDEITRWKEGAWTACYTTLSATGGRAKLIGNVKGSKNWAFKIARKAQSKKLKDWAYHKLTADDAIEGGVMDPDVLAQAEQDLPQEVFLELYFAQATDDGGNPFGMKFIEEIMVDGPSDRPAVVYGVDLAKKQDWTWIIGLDETGTQTTSVRFQKKPWREVAKIVGKICGDVPTLVDSTGVGDAVLEMIQEFCLDAEGFIFSGGINGSKQKLMEGLAVDIQRGGIKIFDERLKSELQTIEYTVKRTGTTYEAPEGETDDGVMSLGMAAKHLRDRPRYEYGYRSLNEPTKKGKR